MIELTREQAVKEFRKMWEWIAEETAKRKEKVYKFEYLEHKGISEENRPKENCYLCEYVEQNKGGYCLSCPVYWFNEGDCGSSASPYMQWCAIEDWKDCYKYAKQIAELPEKVV